ncbi:hypothetical protein GGR95_003582 [Sulfitobacter undariae]|uniref:Uncharacterized protein n=1 Tax=Sulfitobacter undariae TaxID=1563671 RepID=A0A7W6E702_9RHOB|nr:hypothetical protein [Sulfitobacter undariae]MBB3995916.1 hypothetical protein [Sulfitobacter undariae]
MQTETLYSNTRYTPPATESPKQTPPKPDLFGIQAAWLHFANEIEVRRLAKLHMRMERRKRGLDDLISERQRIMNRCIRRMRRSNGKN